MQAIRTAILCLVMAIAGVVVAPTTIVYASGGPVILDGTDSGYHGQVDSSGTISGQWIYTQKAYENLINGVSQTYANSSNGRIAVIGAAEASFKPTSNNCGAAAYWAAQNMASPVPVDFYEGATAINSFFDDVQGGTTKPLLIHLVDGICSTNRMSASELNAVNNRANDIAIHVNRGGALLSNTGAHISGAVNYGWLTTLFPDLTATQSGCSGSSLQLTADGISAFPSLTNSDMSGAWHNCFTSTSTPFPLDVLATQNGHAVVIGGAAVTLPSTVSATASSASPEIGQEICVSANVEQGNPLAPFSGALVSFTVSGANSDISLTDETTDTEGNTPDSCYTGTEIGTDTVTVLAVDPDSDSSLGEATVTVEWSPPSATAPGAPASIAADPGDSEAVVTWTAPTDDGGAVITSYTVTSSPGDRYCTWTSGPLTCTVTGLTNGTEYTFIVTATNSAGEGPATSGIQATPISLPGAPASIAADPGDSEAVVTWTAPTDDGGAVITSYTVTSSPGDRYCTWTSGPLTCTVTGLTNGTEYTFIVTATNSVGTSDPSITARGTPLGLPGAPLSIATETGFNSITLTWETPSSTGGSDITDYIIEYTVDGTNWTVLEDGVSTATTTTVTSLNNNLDYNFRIAAVNAVGTGPSSQLDTDVAPLGLPGAPLSIATETGFNSITLTWETPSSTGGSDITDYIIEYTVDGTNWTVLEDGVSTATTTTVTSLNNNLDYNFRIAAVNAVGTGPSSQLDTDVTLQSIPYVSPLDDDLPFQTPGSAEFIDADTGIGVEVEETVDDNGLKFAGLDDFALQILLKEGNGRVDSGTKSITMSPSGTAEANGLGFLPGSIVEVWIFSDPRLLGTTTVLDDGSFSVSLVIPIDLEVGPYTIQVNGRLANGRERSSNIGITVSEITVSEQRLPSTGTSSHGLSFTIIGLALGANLVLLASRRRPLRLHCDH